MKAHGIGVHSPEEINEFGHEDLKVLSEMLADKPFFFGDDPTNVSILKLDYNVTIKLEHFYIEKKFIKLFSLQIIFVRWF